MTENNAAQAAEQAIKAAIRKAYDDGYNDAKMAPDNCSTYCVERAVRLDSAALLSKLRAPVADERAAFEAWATAIAEKYDVTRNGDHYMEPYTEWVWEAWQASRAALASAPVTDELSLEAREHCHRRYELGFAAGWDQCAASAPVVPQACPTDVCQAGQQGGVLCANDECDRANGVRPASAPVAAPVWNDDYKHDVSMFQPRARSSAPVADKPTLFESWWASEIAANGGATIGADYRHWALRGWLARAPVAGEAYQGDNVAARLDNMADYQPPGSQAQSDLYAAATIWRKHIAHRAAPQASECECSRKSKAVSDSEARL